MDDKEVLRWMGLMGHPFAVTEDDGKGGRRSHAEVNTEAQGIKWAKECNNGRLYRRTTKGWRLTASFPNESKAAA